MMVSSTKKDIGYELREAEIEGLSGLYFAEEDKDSTVRDVADVLLVENGKIRPDAYERLRQQTGGTSLVRSSGRKGFFIGAGCDDWCVTEVYGRNAEEVFVENAG
jgi:hypothetical protein